MIMYIIMGALFLGLLVQTVRVSAAKRDAKSESSTAKWWKDRFGDQISCTLQKRARLFELERKIVELSIDNEKSISLSRKMSYDKAKLIQDNEALMRKNETLEGLILAGANELEYRHKFSAHIDGMCVLTEDYYADVDELRKKYPNSLVEKCKKVDTKLFKKGA